MITATAYQGDVCVTDGRYEEWLEFGDEEDAVNIANALNRRSDALWDVMNGDGSIYSELFAEILDVHSVSPHDFRE